MSWNDGLTGPHLEVAQYPGSPLRVIAGPGTGKTYGLMRRVARLLEGGGDPARLLTVSFTRTAARDLLANLSRLGVPGVSTVQARTLHSLAFSMLGQQGVFEVINRVPRLLLKYEIECLVADLAHEFGGKKRVRELESAFEAAWARLQHHEPGWPTDPEEQRFQVRLMEWLVYHEAMLVGELVPRALDYLRDNPSPVHAPQYDHVLVDEYQDLNRADQELIDLLATNGQLVVVGDEDQSIYVQLRHARPEGISRFNEGHPGTHDTLLTECWRCPKRVIEMANALILHNTRVKTSTLTPRPDTIEGMVHAVQHDNLDEEVTNVAAFVDHYMKSNPSVNSGEILVLCLRRRLGYRIRDELVRLERRAQSYFTEECLDALPAQEGLCLLTLFVRPDDRAALRAWLGLHHRNYGVNGYRRLRVAADSTGLGLRDYLGAATVGSQAVPGHVQYQLDRYRELCRRLATLSGRSGTELIDLLWPAGDEDTAQIRGIAVVASQRVKDAKELLDELLLIITQPELPSEEEDVIRVMSLHKSKGLTAKCVIVCGCVAGALPRLSPGLSSAERNAAFEEQRRLFYVAITRTTETLVLSSAATSSFNDAMQMGLTVSRKAGSLAVLQASPYLSELGSQRGRVLSGAAWRKALGF